MLNCTLYAALSLYEENFSKLMLLLEGLESVEGSAALIAEGMPRLELTVVERSAYTATVTRGRARGGRPRRGRARRGGGRGERGARGAEGRAGRRAARGRAGGPDPGPRGGQPEE